MRKPPAELSSPTGGKWKEWPLSPDLDSVSELRSFEDDTV
jgi:hypothetical protein